MEREVDRRKFIKYLPGLLAGYLLASVELGYAQEDITLDELISAIATVNFYSQQRDINLLDRVNDVRTQMGWPPTDPLGNIYQPSLEGDGECRA